MNSEYSEEISIKCKYSITRNAFDNVNCEMWDTLSSPQFVDFHNRDHSMYGLVQWETKLHCSSVNIYIYIYMYMHSLYEFCYRTHTHTHTHIYIYIYIYIQRECHSVLAKLHPITFYRIEFLGSTRFLGWMPLFFFGLPIVSCSLIKV